MEDSAGQGPEVGKPPTSCRRLRADALASGLGRALVGARWFPLALQIGALLVVGALVVNGVGLGLDMDGATLKTFRKTNLTTLVVWGLWWPGMIAVVLAFGRAWCTVCPMELVNRLADALARKVGWPRARLGALLRGGWMIVLLYLVLQLGVVGFAVHRVPHHSAVLLLTLLGGALLTGLVFRHPRSFCRAFCPANALLSVYGRHTPVQLDAIDPTVCERCVTRECVDDARRYGLDRRSCPSLLLPFRRQASDGCVLCLQCAKVCPHDNIGLGLLTEEAQRRRKGLLRPFEAVFVMIALGFVAHKVIGEVKWLDALFHVVPERLAAATPGVPFGWYEALWFLVLFPTAVWAVIAGVAYLAGHRTGLRSLLLAAATGAAPVVAVAHLAKAAAKLASWVAFLPLALRDPRGLDTLGRLADGSLAAPARLAGLTVIGWAMLALVLLVAWRAIGLARQVPPDSKRAAAIGLSAAAALFGGVMVVWAWPGA